MSISKSILFCILAILALPALATAQLIPAAGDCPEAIVLKVGEQYEYARSPSGPGKVMEIQSRKRDPHFFEKEHNTVWYKFRAPGTGLLTLDLVPYQQTDDYDFLIFKAENTGICDAILSKSLVPVLTNISRTSKAENGRTGLRPNAGKRYVAEGIGDAYSRPLEVKKGEVYFIVVDNVYEGGKGHSILLQLEQMVHVAGRVASDVDGAPLRAEIIYEEKATGKVLLESETDPATGEFDLDLPLKDGVDYNLVIHSDSHFFKMKTFNSKTISSASQDLRVVMPKLIIDKTFPLPDINFQPGLAVFVPSANPTLRALRRFMDRNPSVDVSLEGHVNGVDNGAVISPNPGFEQSLSEERAIAVKRYLAEHDIQPNRMTTRGFGRMYMLFPHAGSRREEEANRRVEVRMGGYSTPGKGMDFENGPWKAALAKAMQSKRFLMVDAYATWCGPCKYMAGHVFAAPNVAAFFNPRFLSLQLDMETEEGKAFASEFGVAAYPTLLFFDPAGKLVGKVEGALNQIDFINLGKSMIELQKMRERYNAGDRDPDLLFTYVKTLGSLGDIPQEVLEGYKTALSASGWYSAVNFRMLAGLARDHSHPIFKELYADRKGFYRELRPDVVHRTLIGILEGPSLRKAVIEQDSGAIAEILGMLEEITGDPMHESVLKVRCSYAAAVKDEEKFFEVSRLWMRSVEMEWQDYQRLSSMASALERDAGTEAALKWVFRSIAENENASNVMYAVRLLAESGQMEKAAKLLERGRELAQQEGRSDEVYQQLKALLQSGES